MKFIRGFSGPQPVGDVLPEDARKVLQMLEDDWRQIKSPDQEIGRFDPARLDAALPYAFMLERTAPNAIRTRVAGQKLHDILRMDPRGMTFGTFFSEKTRDTAMRLADTAFTGPAVVSLPLIAVRGLGRRPVRAEALLLPMRGADGVVTRVMGALVVAGGLHGGRGLRFDLAGDLPVRCDLMTSVWPDRRARRGRKPVEAAKAVPHIDLVQTRTAPKTPTPSRAPALRLVVNNG